MLLSKYQNLYKPIVYKNIKYELIENPLFKELIKQDKL